jgi:KUP system potassium uptake protein
VRYTDVGLNLENGERSPGSCRPTPFTRAIRRLRPSLVRPRQGPLAALGIVYGDLGTSPLYTLQAVIGATGGHFSREAALGSLSLIFWALIITISVKYCLFVMRADNNGEGGILALMSMTGANWSEGRRVLIVMGLFGAALIYGDGIITPAISVLSALEGLNVATDVFKPHIVSIAVAILLALFAIQNRGTAQIAKVFGLGGDQWPNTRSSDSG